MEDESLSLRELFPSGRVKLEGTFSDRNGLYSGTHRFWDEAGRIAFEADFLSGQQTASRSFHPNGRLRLEKHFQAGELHGPERSFHPDGSPLTEISWEGGRKHGLSRIFHPDGRLAEEILYEKGALLRRHEERVKKS